MIDSKLQFAEFLMTFPARNLRSHSTIPLMVTRPWAQTNAIANGRQVLAWLGSSVLLMGLGALYSWSLVNISDAISSAQFQPVAPQTASVVPLD